MQAAKRTATQRRRLTCTVDSNGHWQIYVYSPGLAREALRLPGHRASLGHVDFDWHDAANITTQIRILNHDCGATE